MKVIRDYKFNTYTVVTENFKVRCCRGGLTGTCATDILFNWDLVKLSDNIEDESVAKAVKAISEYVIKDEKINCVVFTDSERYNNIYFALQDKYLTKEEGYTIFKYRPHASNEYYMKHVIFVKD